MEFRKLADIASIQSGLVLSRKEAMQDEGYQYLRLTQKALGGGNGIDRSALEPYRSREPLSGLFVTAEKDVVLSTFVPVNPALITDEEVGLIVPSQLATVRSLDPDKVLPEYLLWQLSQESVLEKMLASTAATTLRGIKVTDIAALEIPIPTIRDQHLVVELHYLNQRKRKLYGQLMEQEERLTKGLADRIIGGRV